MEKERKFTREDILSILLFFGKSIGIPIDKILAARAIEQAIKENYILDVSYLGQWLEFLGERFGLRFSISNEPLESVLSNVRPHNPKLAVLFFPFHTEFVAILGKFWNFLKLQIINESEKYYRVTQSNFKKRIAESSKSDAMQIWISAEPAHSFSTGLEDKEHSSYLDRIRSLIRLESSDIWVIGIYSAAIVILSLVIPIGTQSLVNVLTFGAMYQPVLVLTILVLVALGFAGIMRILQNYVAEYLQQRLFIRLATEVSEKLPKIDYGHFEGKRPESYINYFLDITTLQKGATLLLVDGLGITLQTIIGLLVLVLYHPLFIIFDAVVILVIIFIVMRLLGKEAVATSIKESKAKHEITFWFEELANHRHTFKSREASQYAYLKMESLANNYLTYRNKHFQILIKQVGVFVGIQVIGSGILLGVGGWLVIKGEMSLGQFIAAEIIVSKIMDSLAKAGKYFETFYDVSAALDKIGHLLDIPQEKNGLESVPYIEKPIELLVKNLTISQYSRSIHIPKLKIDSGEIVGLKSDSRKEAGMFLNLLYGLDQGDKGIVEVDNLYSLQEISLDSWRKQVALVRGYKLFSGTVLENLTLGRLDISSVEAREALKITNLWDDILKLPHGINTILTSKGEPLNRDQCFKMNFARGIIHKPRLILVDEAFDFLNKQFAEHFITDYFAQNRSCTLIIYSRKEDVFAMCDRVIEV